MNTNVQVYQQYKRTSVETSPPGKLLLMLYNGCIKNIEHARTAINEKNPGLAHEQIVKAQDIIIELMATLNMDYDISQRLLSVYDYIYNQMVEANIKKDGELLDEIQVFLVDLRNTWQDAIDKVQSSSPDNAIRDNASTQKFSVTG